MRQESRRRRTGLAARRVFVPPDFGFLGAALGFAPPGLDLALGDRFVVSRDVRFGGVARTRASAASRGTRASAAASVGVLPSGPCAGLDVEIDDLERVLLDELAARLHDLAHEGGEDLVRLLGVLDLHQPQDPHVRVEGRLPELLGVHLA